MTIRSHSHTIPACFYPLCVIEMKKRVMKIKSIILNKKRGSLTVEAVLLVPFFIFVLLAFIGILNWFHTAENVQNKLEEGVRIMAVGEYYFKNDTEDTDVTLAYPYKVRINAPLPELIKPFVTQRCVSRAFVGINNLEFTEDDEIVYITAHGEVLHKSSSCTYIKSSVYDIDYSRIEEKRSLSGGKYYPCKKCISEKGNYIKVYISDYGARYHSDAGCNAILKNVIPVKYKLVKNRRFCSKCG